MTQSAKTRVHASLMLDDKAGADVAGRTTQRPVASALSLMQNWKWGEGVAQAEPTLHRGPLSPVLTKDKQLYFKEKDTEGTVTPNMATSRG